MKRFSLSLLFALLAWLVAAPSSTAQKSSRRPPTGAGSLPLVGELPGGSPERFTVVVQRGGEPVHLELRRHPVRGPGSRLLVHGPYGYEEQELPPSRTYRGGVAGDPGSTVIASLGHDGLRAEVLTGDGGSWALCPSIPSGAGALRPGRTRHELLPSELFGGGGELPAPCGTAEGPAAPPVIQPLVNGPADTGCLKRCEVAYDADFEYYQGKGSSVPNVVAAIDAITNQVDFFYARDLNVTLEVTDYVVRTVPFYTPVSGGDLLNQFRTEWTGSLAGVQRDIAHLMTSKPASLIEYGGLAYVGVTCSFSFGYGWSMDGANIVGHEIGHNFGSGHCHDTDPCNNMCGACFLIGPNTRRIKRQYMAGISCLDDVANYPTSLPPYAAPDETYLRKDELAGGSVVFDVLENDADGNCNLLYVADFDGTSERGGTIQRLPDDPIVSGRLSYTPPAVPFIGLDRFQYRVSDGRHETIGTVTIESDALTMNATWRLDEVSGATAADATVGGRDGTLVGSPVWTSGRFGGALSFDGIDDSVSVPALGLNTARATITAWVRRSGNQSPFAGLVHSRDGSTVAGLNLGTANELRYTWNGAGNTFNWSSGLVLPSNQWTFVALVVEPDRARIMMNASLAVNPVSHGEEAFDGELLLGADAAGGRHFAGELDEVRIYDYALTDEELTFLYLFGGYAEAPFPEDGGKLGSASGTLEWVSGLGVLSHDIYLGTDYAAVRDATPASPEYMGSQLETSFAPVGLQQDTPYFWRVDESGPFSMLEGRVWQFELGGLNRWQLDETSGTTAFDAAGSADGTYFGGALLGQPGAAPGTGRSIFLDGSNDRVAVPPLNLNTNRATITCWLRRGGNQSDWAGVVFSREQSTAAGLNFGTNNELRYHWNGAGDTWGWDSGLVVPNDTWVFAALVIEPGRATIHLGENGTLISATNQVSHPAEAFDGQTFLGRDALSPARSFRGFLDDVRIYAEALTVAEVEAVFLAP